MFVNGRRIAGDTEVAPGDVVLVGQHQMTVDCGEREYDERAATIQSDGLPDFLPESSQPSSSRPEPESWEATRRADALSLIGTVADKAFALGNAQQAEQVLSMHLRNTLQQAQVGSGGSEESFERAVEYALKLAQATKKGAWIDYAIELATASDRLLAPALVDRLYEVAPQTSGVKLDPLRTYLARLRKRADGLDSTGRFALRRLEGLERQLSLG